MSATPEGTGTDMVFDATVLSNFARIGQFPRLEQMYAGRGWTTLMVVEEIHRGIEAGYSGLEVVKHALKPSGWLGVTAPATAEEQSVYLQLLAALGSGEASCLAAARMRNMILATDDQAARRKAVEQGVRLTGTLGILIRLVRDARLPVAQANKLLEEMVQQGYRSPVQELDSLV